jgi:hypothetical protein
MSNNRAYGKLSSNKYYNRPMELLSVLAPAVDSLGAMSRADVLDVVLRLVVWVQGNWCCGKLRGFPASERTSWVQGILGFGDDGWRGATAMILRRKTRCGVTTVIIITIHDGDGRMIITLIVVDFTEQDTSSGHKYRDAHGTKHYSLRAD